MTGEAWPQVPYAYSADRYVFHCDCVGNGHYVEVMWDNEDSEFRWLSISEGWYPQTWRECLVAVSRLLRRRHVIGCGVVLDEVNASALQRVLAKHHPIVSYNGTTWTLTGVSDLTSQSEYPDSSAQEQA